MYILNKVVRNIAAFHQTKSKTGKMELGNHPFPWIFFTWGRAASLYMYIGLTHGAQNLCRRIIVVSFRNQVFYVCIYVCM